MQDWMPEHWVTFLGAVGLLVAGVAKGIVEIIKAIKGVQSSIDTHEANAAKRANGKS